MSKSKMSTQEQQSKSKVSEKSAGSEHCETVDEAKKEGIKPAAKTSSQDEWVYDEPVT